MTPKDPMLQCTLTIYKCHQKNFKKEKKKKNDGHVLNPFANLGLILSIESRNGKKLKIIKNHMSDSLRISYPMAQITCQKHNIIQTHNNVLWN
jgi:hypothetical protein